MPKDYPKFENFLGEFENLCYNNHYEINWEGYPILMIESWEGSQAMPSINGVYKEDDRYFWFEPSMYFPRELKNMENEGDFEYYMKKWKDAAEIADYLLLHSWDKTTDFEE